jgi:hypothetical protein
LTRQSQALEARQLGTELANVSEIRWGWEKPEAAGVGVQSLFALAVNVLGPIVKREKISNLKKKKKSRPPFLISPNVRLHSEHCVVTSTSPQH